MKWFVAVFVWLLHTPLAAAAESADEKVGGPTPKHLSQIRDKLNLCLRPLVNNPCKGAFMRRAGSSDIYVVTSCTPACGEFQLSLAALRKEYKQQQNQLTFASTIAEFVLHNERAQTFNPIAVAYGQQFGGGPKRKQ